MQTSNSSANTKPSWYQKNYLVHPEAQFRILLRLGAVALIFAITLCSISYYWILNLRPLFDQTLAGPATPAVAFQTVANLLLFRLFTAISVMAVAFIAWGIFLSHRFTGPIWKLERDLHNFLSGEQVSHIKFREKDEFQELPPLINKLIDGYRRDSPPK